MPSALFCRPGAIGVNAVLTQHAIETSSCRRTPLRRAPIDTHERRTYCNVTFGCSARDLCASNGAKPPGAKCATTGGSTPPQFASALYRLWPRAVWVSTAMYALAEL